MPKKSAAITPVSPSLESLLEAGAHFGHLRSRRHPRMRPFIYTVRNRVSVINLEETSQQIEAAATFLSRLCASGEQILFVGTKRQAKATIKAVASKLGMPYVHERWLGGTLTNSEVILRNIEMFVKLAQELSEESNRTKKEQLDAERKVAKLERRLAGLVILKSEVVAPAKTRSLRLGAMVVVDVRREKTAVAEAQSSGLPIVALIDTDADPQSVDYPIVINDDAAAAVGLVIEALGQAIAQGLKEVKAPEDRGQKTADGQPKDQ